MQHFEIKQILRELIFQHYFMQPRYIPITEDRTPKSYGKGTGISEKNWFVEKHNK